MFVKKIRYILPPWQNNLTTSAIVLSGAHSFLPTWVKHIILIPITHPLPKATPIKVILELEVVKLSTQGMNLDPTRFHVFEIEITFSKLQIFLTYQFFLGGRMTLITHEVCATDCNMNYSHLRERIMVIHHDSKR
jgi:hypothetical protein